MIHAGEDPRFITRRILICAAEDVGLADPMALVLAVAAHTAAEFTGWPEARIPIAEAAVYIATASKSNSACVAIDKALEDVRSGRTLAVPQALRDASYAGAQRLGHGQDYQYAHDFPGHFVAQDYLGAARRYYEPTEQGSEKKIKERLEKWRSQIEALRGKDAARTDVTVSQSAEETLRHGRHEPAPFRRRKKRVSMLLKKICARSCESLSSAARRDRFPPRPAPCWRGSRSGGRPKPFSFTRRCLTRLICFPCWSRPWRRARPSPCRVLSRKRGLYAACQIEHFAPRLRAGQFRHFRAGRPLPPFPAKPSGLGPGSWCRL